MSKLLKTAKIPAGGLMLALCLVAASALCPSMMFAAPAQDASSSAVKPVSFLGTVQSISGKLLTVKSDAGATMQVAIQDNARLLRIAPGQKSLQGASAFNLSDLQVGDRVLARGVPSADGKQLAAAMLVSITKTDITQMQEKEREEWRRGAGGIVKSVDPASGAITISVSGGKQTLTVDASKSTVIRRYAPGSVKFDDAKPSTLAEIKPGDEIRARGTRSADGQTFAADGIVSGSFRNIAGVIASIDPTASTMTVTDLATKHPVVIQVTPDTELKKLDPAVAERIAMRLKGGGRPGAGRPGAGGPGGDRRASPEGAPAGRPGQAGGDLQQLLTQAPAVPLKDFSKGSAVMLVATEGTSPGSVTAVTVVAGVEPMLQASASGSQAMLSSAWSLGGGGAAEGGGEGGDQGGGGDSPQ